jgi:hypothetical protein
MECAPGGVLAASRDSNGTWPSCIVDMMAACCSLQAAATSS